MEIYFWKNLRVIINSRTFKIVGNCIGIEYRIINLWNRTALLAKLRRKGLSFNILAKQASTSRNQAENWLSSKIPPENCYLVTFWQNERTSCKTLSKVVTLENSDRKNDYLALICRKMVSLVDSGRRKVTSQYSGWMQEVSKKGYLGGFWQKKCHFEKMNEKLVYPERFRQKIVLLQDSGRMNVNLARN